MNTFLEIKSVGPDLGPGLLRHKKCYSSVHNSGGELNDMDVGH